MKKVYLASPFFNDVEIERMESVKKILEDKNLEVFAPFYHQNPQYEFGSLAWRKETYESDIAGIDNADVMVAIISNGNYSDSGTCVEIGKFLQMKRPIIVVNLSERNEKGEQLPINLMISDSLHAYIQSYQELKDYDFDTMPVITYDNYVW